MIKDYLIKNENRQKNEEFEKIELFFNAQKTEVDRFDVIKLTALGFDSDVIGKELTARNSTIRKIQGENATKIADWTRIERKKPKLAAIDFFKTSHKDFFNWYYKTPIDIIELRKKQQAYLDSQERNGLSEQEYNELFEHDLKEIRDAMEDIEKNALTKLMNEIKNSTGTIKKTIQKLEFNNAKKDLLLKVSDFKEYYKINDDGYVYMRNKGQIIETSIESNFTYDTYIRAKNCNEGSYFPYFFDEKNNKCIEFLGEIDLVNPKNIKYIRKQSKPL